MDKFNAMLCQVTKPSTAAMIAEMLREESVLYAQLAKQLQADQLALPIREVRASLLKES